MEATTELKTTGVAKQRVLAGFKPNDWNPNKMTPRKYAALKQSLKDDGWLASQALLIWGKDEKGNQQDVIIDGEHRWQGATELGYLKGPVVVLDGLTRAQAMALTIKLDKARGEFEKKGLAQVLAELDRSPEFEDLNLAAVLGFEDEEFQRVMSEQEELVLDSSENAGPERLRPEIESRNELVKMVPIYIANADHQQFVSDVAALAKRFSTDTVSDTVQRAIRELTKS